MTKRFPLLLAVLILLLSSTVPLYRFLTAPAGQVFSGIQFYSDDYAVYTHTIMQGLRGRWTVVDKFTSEPHLGSLFHIQYLLLGKVLGPPVESILSIFGLTLIPPAAIVYHLSRFLFGALALWAAWQFVKEIFKEDLLRLVSWILILTGGLFSKDLSPLLNGVVNWPSLEPFFREPDVFTRFASQPHFLTGSFALLIIFTLFLKMLKDKKVTPKKLLVVGTLSFLVGFSDPSSILTITITLAVITLLFGSIYLSDPKKVSQLFLKVKIPFVLTATIALGLVPSVLYLQNLRQQEPWLTLAAFDRQQNFSLTPMDLVPTFGLPLLLAPLGLILLFAKRSSLEKGQDHLPSPALLLSWIISFCLLFFILAPVFQINRLRLFHPPLFIAIDLLAAYAIFQVANFIYRKFHSLSTGFVALALAFLIILPTIPSSIASLKGQLGELADYSTLVYPSVKTVEAFNYLKEQTPESSVVAALYESGSMLPYFSGDTSFAGNLSETLNYGQKSASLLKFLTGSMTSSQAQDFLDLNHIDYILWGPQEKSVGGNLLKYPFLSVVYANPQVEILKFQTTN